MQLAFKWPRTRPAAGVQRLVHTGWTGGGPLVPAKWLKPPPSHPTPGWDLSGAAGGGRCSPHPLLTGGLTSGLTSGLGSGLPGIPGRRFRHRWPVPGSCKCRPGGWPWWEGGQTPGRRPQAGPPAGCDSRALTWDRGPAASFLGACCGLVAVQQEAEEPTGKTEEQSLGPSANSEAGYSETEQSL